MSFSVLFGRCNLKDNEKSFAEVNKLKDSLLKPREAIKTNCCETTTKIVYCESIQSALFIKKKMVV